jgi:glucan phosphoethanolaminetransferase (alkaline phosphatase superfamily)
LLKSLKIYKNKNQKTMKKTILLLFACLTVSSAINAQDSNPKTKNASGSIYTALKPIDASPYVFGSQQELNDKQANKKGVVLSEIKANANNPEKVKTLREELWRIENATVITKK